MGKSLVADLGARYVRDFFNHAMFDCGDGKIHRLRAVDDNHLTVDSITLSDKTPKWERGYVKSSVLEDFASFKYPKLGFTPFSQGIKHLLDGDWIGFAVSEDLAVALSISQSHDRFADVFYRGRIVGNVDANGQVNLVNKVLQRASVKKKLFQ
jgi:hypothetical protein